jgi:hypothetical protein
VIGPFHRSPKQGQISREQRGRGARRGETADGARALAALAGDEER